MKRNEWKRVLAVLLCAVMMMPACTLAEASAQSWLYSFSAGEALSGEGMSGIRDFLDAVQIELTTQQQETGSMGQVVMLSYGKNVLSLRAAVSGTDDTYGLTCSLLGDVTLQCRQDQLADFMLTLVQMLADSGILKDQSLEQAQSLALKASDILLKVTDSMDSEDPNVGIDLQIYMDRVGGLATAAEEIPLDGTDSDCPGAVLKRIWNLSEEDLNALVDAGLEKVSRIPVVGDALRDGKLQIGSQPVSDAFIRQLFASMHGDAVLLLYEDAEGQVLRLGLRIPDISDVVSDPEFSQVRGLDISITRSESEGSRESVTAVKLTGLEKELFSVRMEKRAGTGIAPLPDAVVYQVGEMNSSELLDLLLSLGITISKNAINMIMDLPRIVFDTLIDKLF